MYNSLTIAIYEVFVKPWAKYLHEFSEYNKFCKTHVLQNVFGQLPGVPCVEPHNEIGLLKAQLYKYKFSSKTVTVQGVSEAIMNIVEPLLK